jgi:hypothetical protein
MQQLDSYSLVVQSKACQDNRFILVRRRLVYQQIKVDRRRPVYQQIKVDHVVLFSRFGLILL